MNQVMYVIFANHFSKDGYVQTQILWATNDEKNVEAKYKEFKNQGIDCYIDECNGFVGSN